jgi:hypothetical protein
MEPLWSPVVATRGNQRQVDRPSKPQKQAKSVATGCHRLRREVHGKEEVESASVLLSEVARNWRAPLDLQGLTLESRLPEPALFRRMAQF